MAHQKTHSPTRIPSPLHSKRAYGGSSSDEELSRVNSPPMMPPSSYHIGSAHPHADTSKKHLGTARSYSPLGTSEKHTGSARSYSPLGTSEKHTGSARSYSPLGTSEKHTGSARSYSPLGTSEKHIGSARSYSPLGTSEKQIGSARSYSLLGTSEKTRSGSPSHIPVPILLSYSSRHIPKPEKAPNISESSSRIPTFSPVHAVSTAAKSGARHTSPVDTVPATSAHTTENQPISPSNIPAVTKHSSASSSIHFASKVPSRTAEYPAIDVNSPGRDPPASRPQAWVTKFGGSDSKTPESNSLTSQSVKFLSPVHQGVPSVKLHRNESEKGSEMTPKGDYCATPELLKLDKEFKERLEDTAAPSGPSVTRERYISVQSVHHEHPSSVMSSPEKQTDPAGGLGPISSTESLEVTGSEISLASRRSLPVTLGSNRSAFVQPAFRSLSQQQSILLSVSLPHLGEGATATKGRRSTSSAMHHTTNLPQLSTISPQLLNSQINLLQVEKDAVESQLRQCQATIASLRAQNRRSREKAAKAEDKVCQLEDHLFQKQEIERELRQTHVVELAEVQRKMRGQLEVERERLLNQIRQLTMMKEEADAKVDGLEDNLSEVQEAVRTASEASTSRNEASYQREIEALRTELSVLQELYQESEQSQEALVEERKELEERARQLEMEERRRRQQDARNVEEVCVLEGRLKVAESRVAQLEAEKASTLVAIERRITSESIKQQAKHSNDMRKLKQELNDARATIEAQEQRIQKLHGDMTAGKRSNWEMQSPTEHEASLIEQKSLPKRKGSHERKFSGERETVRGETAQKSAGLESTRGRQRTRSDGSLSSSTSRSLSPPSQKGRAYFGGRWTAHRADVRKHSEEMLPILEALEQEGYGPTKTTTDEVICHLWREREHMKGKLQEKNVGGDHARVLQEWQEEKFLLEQKLRDAQQEFSSKHEEAEALQEGLRKKLKEHLESWQLEVEQCTSLKQQEEVLARENAELRKKLRELTAELSEKTTQITRQEVDMASSQRETSQVRDNLSLEKHQNSLLRAQVESLKTQLASQHQELAAALHSRDQVKEKLGSAGAHVHQTRQEILQLKTKVGKLEAEVRVQRQQLGHVTYQRDALQEQLESTTMQLTTKESQLSREKTNSASFQSKVESLSEDLRERGEELQRVCSRRDDLEVEVSSVRKDLLAGQENITLLETELLALQSDYESCQNELFQGSSHITELEMRLSSTTAAELSRSKELAGELQASLTDTLHQLEVTSNSLEAEKQRTCELTTTLESLNKKSTESVDAGSLQFNRELDQKKEEVQTLHKETRSLKTELSDAQKQLTTLQSQLEKLQEDFKSQKFKLSQARASESSLQRKFDTANRELASCKRELEQSRKELSELRKDYQSLASSKNKADSSLSVRVSELEIEKKRAAEAQREVEEREKEVRAVQLQVQKLQGSLSCEQERCSTLELELSATRAKLQEEKEQCGSMVTQLQQLREGHQKESDRAQQAQAELRLELQHSMEQYSELHCHYKALDSKNSQQSSALQELTAEINELQAKNAVMLSELSNVQGMKATLEKRLSLLNKAMDEKKKRMTEEIETQKLDIDNLKAELSRSQYQEECTASDLEKFKSRLEIEQATTTKLQADLDTNVAEVSSLQSRLQKVEREVEGAEKRVETVVAELKEARSKIQELSSQLQRSQQEHGSAAETHTSLSHTVAPVRATHEWKRDRQEENGMTMKDLNQERERLTAQLHLCQGELASCTNKLTLMEQQCTQLDSALQTKTDMHQALELRHTQLESSHSEGMEQVLELSETLSQQTAAAAQLKVELDCSQQECESLQEQLQLQRKTAASSLNRIQKHSQKKTTQLQVKIREVSDKLKEAHSSMKAMQKDVIASRVESAELNAHLVEERENNEALRTQLKKETTALRLCEQKAEQLQLSLQMEFKAKSQIQESLSEEQAARSDSESAAAYQQQQHASATRELSYLHASLAEERTYTRQLKKDISVLEAELASTRHQLDASNESLKASLKQAMREASTERHKYHRERKALKENVKELQSNLRIIRAQYDSRGEDISRLDATNQRVIEEQQELMRKLSETEQSLQAKKDECQMSQTKIEALEVQVSQLQMEVIMLGQAQLESEEYRRKVEANSRSDMKQILSEVTLHMEQQYTAHRYLEKLHSENEAMALREREREIDHLRRELQHKRNDSKHYKMQIKSLEQEAKYLRSKQKDQERSRHRLESRLEQVNETLNQSLPIRSPLYHKSTVTPLHSTPVYSKSPNYS